MFTVTFLGSFAGALLGGIFAAFIVNYIDEIIKWAKDWMARISPLIKIAQVWIQRIPGAIKQFLYYMEHGDYMVKESTRPATQSEIDKLRDKMSEREWRDFTGEGNHMANVERAA